MAHHYKLASFHALSPQTEYKSPSFNQALGHFKSRIVYRIRQEEDLGNSNKRFLTVVACLLKHTIESNPAHLWSYWIHWTRIPQRLCLSFAFHKCVSALIHPRLVFSDAPCVNPKMCSGLRCAYSQYIVSASMTFPSLRPFQGAVWKIGRRGTGDKGRPAILLGASPRLVWRQKKNWRRTIAKES